MENIENINILDGSRQVTDFDPSKYEGAVWHTDTQTVMIFEARIATLDLLAKALNELVTRIGDEFGIPSEEIHVEDDLQSINWKNEGEEKLNRSDVSVQNIDGEFEIQIAIRIK